MGKLSHSFHARAVLKDLYAVLEGTESGLLSAHSCTVTNNSEKGLAYENQYIRIFLGGDYLHIASKTDQPQI